MTEYKKPLIGITCGEIVNKDQAWAPEAFGQSRTYVDSIIQAGGAPILLPLTEDTALLHQLCALLDGFCMAGGNDLHPQLYGQQPESQTMDFSELRDKTEQIILQYALDHNKPILAICRGMQLLNVHFGGTLHQDIAKAKPDALDHDSSTKLETLTDLSHTLTIAADSKLATLVGPQELGTNAHHHQAIDVLGKGVKAVAWAADGIIEAIELPDYPYAIGVQAHPESLTQVEPRWLTLFQSFIAASND